MEISRYCVLRGERARSPARSGISNRTERGPAETRDGFNIRFNHFRATMEKPGYEKFPGNLFLTVSDANRITRGETDRKGTTGCC